MTRQERLRRLAQARIYALKLGAQKTRATCKQADKNAGDLFTQIFKEVSTETVISYADALRDPWWSYMVLVHTPALMVNDRQRLMLHLDCVNAFRLLCHSRYFKNRMVRSELLRKLDACWARAALERFSTRGAPHGWLTNREMHTVLGRAMGL